MGARRKYPQFDDWTAEEIDGLLRLAKLSGEDKHIAISCILREKYFVDVGAAHNLSRSTISRRMKKSILPELERMAKRYKKAEEAGA